MSDGYRKEISKHDGDLGVIRLWRSRSEESGKVMDLRREEESQHPSLATSGFSKKYSTHPSAKEIEEKPLLERVLDETEREAPFPDQSYRVLGIERGDLVGGLENHAMSCSRMSEACGKEGVCSATNELRTKEKSNENKPSRLGRAGS